MSILDNFAKTANNLKAVGTTLVVAVVCAGCSLSPFVEKSTLDYNNTIENVSNISLVTNILRGRDGAPLYFPDLSQIRGSLTVSAAAQTTLPFGPPRYADSTRNSLQDGPFTASSNPTFDIAPLNTKQFYLGLLNPVSERLFSYYIQRYGGRSSVYSVLYLMIDSYDERQANGLFINVDWHRPEFSNQINIWSGPNGPRIIALPKNPKRMGPPVKADADSILKADAAGFQVKEAGEGKIQLAKPSSDAAICFPNGKNKPYIAILVNQNSDVKAPVGEVYDDNSADKIKACNPGNNSLTGKEAKYVLHLRSVEQIFYFLGAIVDEDYESSITKSGDRQGCPLIPFYLSQTPTKETRFGTPYRGATYYVSGTDRKDKCGYADYTLPILSILADLLNLSRDANEIPTTKAVQAIK